MIALAVGVLLIGVTAACSAAALRVRGFVAFVLAAAVLAFAEIVAVSHALSVVEAYERRWFLVALAVVALASVAVVVTTRPPLPSGPRSVVVRELLADRVLAALALVVLAELAYLAALAVLVPPVEGDAVAYHLPRALFWIQDGSVGPSVDATDARINEYPPDAELAQGATLLLSESVRWVGIPQLLALVVAVLAVYGIATRVGLDRREAAFGALVVPTLPVVALQAPTALNDVVVASLVAVATFFALGRSWPERVVGAIAVALLVGTKGTGLFALPVLFAIVVYVHRGRRLAQSLVVGAGAVAVGAGWYWANLLKEDGLDADAGTFPDDWGVLAIGARATRYAVEVFELPGAEGKDKLLYALAAAAILLGGLARRRLPTAAVAALVALLPFTVLPAERVLHRLYWNGWELVGYPEATRLDPGRDSTVASNLQSWYGPAGAVLTVVAIVLAIRLVQRGLLPAVALIFAMAPIVFVIECAAVVDYYDVSGRFVMGGVLLTASVWGLVRSWTPGAVATVAVCGTTVLLSLVNSVERPAGLDLLERTGRPSIWTLPRESAQSPHPEVARLIRYVDGHVSPGEPIALSRDGWSPFAYAGWPTLEHRLVYADTLAEADGVSVRWAVLPERAALRSPWRVAFRSRPWAVYHRPVP